ncbi:MAG: 16S rRNA processing protein RimM [Firmicutes bacterium]|nr:16S rRNA processing protein RimM [Bacillota bacterium]HPU01575.1 ribosome maturation factor RimM [Bacillota bacterium]
MNSESGAGKRGVAVGRVLAPYGTAGLVKVLPTTDFPERCHDLKEVACELHGAIRRFTVERASLYGRFWLIKFAGIETREQAAALRGAWVLIRPEERVALPAGSYYYDQIIGLEVYNAAGERLGRVKDVIPGAAHDFYLVRREAPGETEFLLPAVKAFVREIDLAGGRIVADPPEGLMEL